MQETERGSAEMDHESLTSQVLQHDAAIISLTQSIEHLAKAQARMSEEIKETNKRLEELMRYLTKQQVFTNRLEALDKELEESFKRVHRRIDEVVHTQRSDNGCASVKLLHKDVEAIAKETKRLVTIIEKHEKKIEEHNAKLQKSISPALLRWAGGIVIVYGVTFGVYVFQTLADLQRTNAKITTMLERDMKDTAKLMERTK